MVKDIFGFIGLEVLIFVAILVYLFTPVGLLVNIALLFYLKLDLGWGIVPVIGVASIIIPVQLFIFFKSQ